MSTALVIAFSDLATDPRVNRQIRFLHGRYDVVAAGLGDPEIPGVRFVPIDQRPKTRLGQALSALQLLAGAHEGYYWRQGHVAEAYERLRALAPDVVVANDLESLPLALRLVPGERVIFDAHEYAPQEWSDSLVFRVFFQRYRLALCQRYMPRAGAATTVCRSIAELYRGTTGVLPEVLTNAPDFHELVPSPTDPRRIRLVHHGIAGASRKLEGMIAMMDHLDERFELDFLLTTPHPAAHAYREQLRQHAAGKRVRFLDPVPMRELPGFLNQYDVGVFLLPPTNVNYELALPNKFFEFVQARLAIAVGPSLEMARIVRETGCGIVADDFTPEAMAARLRALDAGAIMALKRRAHDAAWELSAEHNRRLLLTLADRVAGAARHGEG